jgi:glycerophosphoryl diester phosphodiesterase
MALAELKLLRRKFRYNTRNLYMNEEGFSMVTFEETIEMLLNLNDNFPRGTNPIGLYLETKMYGFYLENYGENIVDRVFEVLKRYGLETAAKASAKLPIIIECFEREALLRMRELTDLPLVYLMFY